MGGRTGGSIAVVTIDRDTHLQDGEGSEVYGFACIYPAILYEHILRLGDY